VLDRLDWVYYGKGRREKVMGATRSEQENEAYSLLKMIGRASP
jgi:hypothetical protein